MKTMWQQLCRSRDDDRGASLVEYALLLALIAVVCITAISFLGHSASSGFSHYGDCVSKSGTNADLTNCGH